MLVNGGRGGQGGESSLITGNRKLGGIERGKKGQTKGKGRASTEVTRFNESEKEEVEEYKEEVEEEEEEVEEEEEEEVKEELRIDFPALVVEPEDLRGQRLGQFPSFNSAVRCCSRLERESEDWAVVVVASGAYTGFVRQNWVAAWARSPF